MRNDYNPLGALVLDQGTYFSRILSSYLRFAIIFLVFVCMLATYLWSIQPWYEVTFDKVGSVVHQLATEGN